MLRLRAFRARHPHAVIGTIADGCWQARLPREDGEAVVTRYSLRTLLDRLDEICSSAAQDE